MTTLQPATPASQALVSFDNYAPSYWWCGIHFQANHREVTALEIVVEEFVEEFGEPATVDRALTILDSRMSDLPDSVWEEGDARYECDRARGLLS